MKLDNFKELLLKKAKNDGNLQTLIRYMKEDYLADHVIESLRKMPSAKKANRAALDFAQFLSDETGPQIMHDALSHHASHYKAALKGGNKKLADKHMAQIFKTIKLAKKITADGDVNYTDSGSGGVTISAIDPRPWERQVVTNLKTNTKGFSKPLSGNPNFDWLRGNPSKNVEKKLLNDLKRHGKTKAWPLSEVKVNDKFLHLEDVDPTEEYQEHPLDRHPIFKFGTKASSKFSDIDMEDYYNELDSYYDDEGGFTALANRLDRHDYDTIGIDAPDAIHDDIEGLSFDEESKPVDPMAALANITGKDKYKMSLDNKPEQAAAPTPEPKAEPAKQPEQAPNLSLDDIQAKLARIRGKK